MRIAAALCLLGALAFAQDLPAERAAVRAAIQRGRYAEAETFANRALNRWDGDPILMRERAKAVRGRARLAQREAGYVAAIDVLEGYVNDTALVPAYAEACLWGGREERGIRALRTSTADRKVRTWHEFNLLSHLRRYDEIRVRAEQVQDNDWHAWARKQVALRARFDERTDRARWIAIGGVIALLVVAAGLLKFAPPASAASSGSATS